MPSRFRKIVNRCLLFPSGRTLSVRSISQRIVKVKQLSRPGPFVRSYQYQYIRWRRTTGRYTHRLIRVADRTPCQGRTLQLIRTGYKCLAGISAPAGTEVYSRSKWNLNWTRIQLSADLLNRPKFFRMAQFNTSINYDWRYGRYVSQTLPLQAHLYKTYQHHSRFRLNHGRQSGSGAQFPESVYPAADVLIHLRPCV